MKLNILKNNLFNLSVTKKITLAGILIVLAMLFNKVIAINYIAFIPFVRVSFGGLAIVIFASIVLGPFYGLVVGVAADVLGYFIFDASAFAWFPQITLTYALLGLLPFFIFKLVTLIKNEKVMMIIEYSLFTLIFVGVTFFFAFSKELTLYGTTYSFELYQRILIPSLVLLLLGITIVTNTIIHKKSDNTNIPVNIYQLSFVVFISEILINFMFGSLMKAWAFGFNMFYAILISQGVIMFFNIPYNSYLIFVIMKLGRRTLLS